MTSPRSAAAPATHVVWLGWGVLLAACFAAGCGALHVLVDAPTTWAPVAIGCGTALVAGGVAASLPALRRHAAGTLTATLVVAAVAGLVLAVYLVVVVGFHGAPARGERGVLALSMAAAAVAVLLAGSVRGRVLDVARRRLGAGRGRPTQALETFGARMTRAVPMDELLLQLAETLRETIAPAGAEIWTGVGGRLERSVSVPERPRAQIALDPDEIAVVARSRATGNAWVSMWLPALLTGREQQQLRVAPIAHLGELLGLLVVTSTADDAAYDDVTDSMLTDLARQVGLALHNVRLDSALQESLEQLRRRNEELQASRARIVAAADASRREIERNLHDGAQQHLVALAVKLGLARSLLGDASPQAATLLEDLRGDVQTTIDAVRELAHGIYPPLLRDRGLGEALQTAADRCPLPVMVDVQTTARYPADAEAAIYFCCLEAMQNAGKHAGADASITITVEPADGQLCFSVRDDGRGFDPSALKGGHGFTNMTDRLGAMGGGVDVDSTPGSGTCVSGWVPSAPVDVTAPAAESAHQG